MRRRFGENNDRPSFLGLELEGSGCKPQYAEAKFRAPPAVAFFSLI